jgi:dephospho-CoA kinase
MATKQEGGDNRGWCLVTPILECLVLKRRVTMSMTEDERNRLQREMKRSKREADDLEDEIARETDEDKKRSLTSDLEDAQAKARRLKRKLR